MCRDASTQMASVACSCRPSTAPSFPYQAQGASCRLPPGAAWWEEGGGSGRLALLGSAAMFDDEWLSKEDNTALLDFLLGALLRAVPCWAE